MPRRPSADLTRLAGLVGLVAALALAELVLGVLGPGAPSARAEAFVFAEIRPWVLILLAVLVSRLDLRRRLLAYSLFLAAAGLAETFYLVRLGGAGPWTGTLRAWAVAAVLLALADLLLGLARRRFGWIAAAAAGIALALILALPTVRAGYAAVANDAPPEGPAAHRPRLLLMTALPLIWGEKGAFDPGSRPAGAYRLLQEEFTVEPIDTLDRQSLGKANLLLLAQPRWLAPSELVDLDSWVRAGGRVLILTDPRLDWPSGLPLGDVRRPPPAGLLSPLLDHWGLRIAAVEPDGGGLHEGRKLVLRQSGRFEATGGRCRVFRPWLAECRLGLGRAALIADADLMRDDLWMGQGPDGASRRRRIADNPLVLADRLDALAGLDRARARAQVRWPHEGADPIAALRPAALALLLLALAGAAALLRRRVAG